MLKKNTAGQKWQVYAFNRTTNVPLGAGEAANITATLSKDWAAAVALGDVNPVALAEAGYFLFDLTQAETNFDVGALFPVSSTGTTQVIATPATQSTWTPDIAAIKAKTDLIPADPADESNTQAGFVAVNGFLAQIIAWIDTEIASIKAKTDLIPAAPASEATLTILSKLLHADLAIDTTVTPWALVYLENGTGGIGVGVELLRQPLKQVTGANITATDQIVGQSGL